MLNYAHLSQVYPLQSHWHRNWLPSLGRFQKALQRLQTAVDVCNLCAGIGIVVSSGRHPGPLLLPLLLAATLSQRPPLVDKLLLVLLVMRESVVPVLVQGLLRSTSLAYLVRVPCLRDLVLLQLQPLLLHVCVRLLAAP